MQLPPIDPYKCVGNGRSKDYVQLALGYGHAHVLRICQGFQLKKVKHEVCHAFVLMALHQIPSLNFQGSNAFVFIKT